VNDLFWALWLIDFLSQIGVCVFFGVLIGATLAFGIGTVFDGEAKKAMLLAFLLPILIFVLGAMIPSKPTMYVMLGVKMTNNVMQSDFGKKIQQIVDTQLDVLVDKYGVKKESK
jgi:NhaP-type Na+/H+ or K+/H+ antiporter